MKTPQCPNCKTVADDINLTVNISERDEDGEFTGDTDYAQGGSPVGSMPSIGFYCRECGYDSIDPAQVVAALKELNLFNLLPKDKS